MPLLDIQRRGQQLGRIRIGQLVQASNGKMRPARLDTFRFTTQSKVAAEAIADLYGGDIKDWNNEYEVITNKAAIGVTVPPRDQVVSQWYEMWSKGGCARRCDSQTEQISGKPCLCPHADDPTDLAQVEAAAKERARLAAMNPPQACKAVTRINLMLPDLPGLGVFRLDTHSYYAAVEIGDAAELMQAARDKGVFLPAVLRIDHRQRVAQGRTKRFPVPVLEVMATFRQIASGQLEAGGLTAQLPPPPGEQPRAITSGQPTPSPATTPALDAGEQPVSAQEIADRATAVTTREEVEALAERAKAARVEEDLVQTQPDRFEELGEFLRDLWRALPPEGGDAA